MISAKNLHPTVRSGLGQIPRETFHVCKATAENADYLYDNIPRGHLFHTILEATAVAEAYNDIIVWPGQYKEDATIPLDYDSMRLLAAEMGPNHAKTRTEIRQHGNVACPCITVGGAHNVEVAGFRITPYSDDSYEGILAGAAASPYGLYLHDNYFYSVEIGNMAQAITLGETGHTYDCDSACIYNNYFYAGGTSAISGTPAPLALGIIQIHKASRFDIRNNVFWHYTNHADNYAINIYDNAGYRGNVLDNKFIAAEIGVEAMQSVAIKNPTSVGGDIIIDGNSFVNYGSDENCIASPIDNCLGHNWNNEAVIASND